MSQYKSDQSLNGKDKTTMPDPEVVPRAKRRQFSAEYKLRILDEADQCREPGQIGALLRREGLYSSHLSNWRRQQRQGQLQGLQSQKRGRKSDPEAAELKRLHRENERLRQQLDRAALIIDVQKKVSQLLGLPPSEIDENE
jgi:transposase